MFLSHEELVTLTGYKRAADQIAWLTRQAIQHHINRLGRPVVAMESVVSRHQERFEIGAVR
jgi:hypothetical protein